MSKPVPKEPTKPARVEDLAPPFSRIGEEGWAAAVLDLLTSYGVPLPEPQDEAALALLEEELGRSLPTSLRTFLAEVGPLQLDQRILPPAEIRSCESVWFRDRLPPERQALLSRFLTVASHGSDDFVVLDLESGGCAVLSHDPLGLSKPLPDFDTFVKVLLIQLRVGYYGWPDKSMEDLVDAAVVNLIGYSF